VKTLACSIVAMSTFAIGTSAFAATVTPIKGAVQVNTGSGFRPVSGAAEVAPGTSVMVSPDGRGEIRYSDGCKTALVPGSVAVVPPVSPCAQGQARAGDYRYDSPDYTGYIVTGAAAAAVGVGIYNATRNQGNNIPVFAPISPASP
jgi:hypothetical protein